MDNRTFGSLPEAVQNYGTRAEIGVDGNCGFAQIGPDIQQGEAEFVEIVDTGDPSADASLAATKALQALEARLGVKMTHWVGQSHPRHC